jgi:hypothetical protein
MKGVGLLEGAGEEMVGDRYRSLAKTAAAEASIQENKALVEMFLPEFYLLTA